ncbi:MAG: hypothetical protein KKF44_02110 [Nanoarchaeota archaeon]|nr:hypothetical protein [Nanoarchaeota archaeon]
MLKKESKYLFLYIALGIVVIFASIGAVYILSIEKSANIENPADLSAASPVIRYVENCLISVAKSGLNKLGEQGRIYPSVFLESEEGIVTYFYYKGNNYFPGNIEILEKELSTYIMQNLGYCIDDFTDLPYYVDDDKEKMESRVRFSENTTVLVTYPMTAQIDGNDIRISEFSAVLDFDFLSVYELTSAIYEKTKNDPEWIDIDFLADQAYEIRLIRVSENSLIYEIMDAKGPSGQEFNYRFAMKYKT